MKAALAIANILLVAGTAYGEEIKVMTSGAFAAACLDLIPQFEHATHDRVVRTATSMGVGPNSSLSRLQRGEQVDVVIVADAALDELIRQGNVIQGSRVALVRSGIGMAVRAGAPRPDISSVEALKRTLLQAKSIGYSTSVSGTYLSTGLFPHLGLAERIMGKTRKIDGAVGDGIARGDVEIGFQQIAELLPVKGIDYVGPLPPEVRRVTVFSAGIAAGARKPEAARALIKFFASPAAAAAIRKSGLVPVASN